MTGFCLRSDEDLDIGIDEYGFQYADLKIYYDKTRNRFYQKAIYCDEDGEHNPNAFNNNACSNNNNNILPIQKLPELPPSLQLPQFNIAAYNNNGNNNNAEVQLHGGNVLSRVLNDEKRLGVGEYDEGLAQRDGFISNDIHKPGGQDVGAVEFNGIGMSASYYSSSRCIGYIKEEDGWMDCDEWE